jgi:antagonist of KipI
MSIDVIRPGLLTSIQDMGRYGWRQFGVIVGGAMDPLALRVANLLVGNDPADAALEVTLLGPTLRFSADAVIAICGGDLAPRVHESDVPLWRPVWIRSGSELRFGAAAAGCRAYVAVAGGFDVPEVLGSRGTYFRAGFGGLAGRPLRAGDCLITRPASPQAVHRGLRLAQQAGGHPIASTTWSSGNTLAAYLDSPTIRASAGRQFDDFSNEEQDKFFSSEYAVTVNSDRMGYRLAGLPLRAKTEKELLSEAVIPGTVQVPSNGQPIVLMADCPVTGGYPKIAQVACVDLPVLAQLRPGAKVRFRLITISEAESLYREREAGIVKLRCAIALQ